MTVENYTKEERYQISKRVTLIGAVINLSLALIKMIIGILGRSNALFADGVHSLSDLISDFLVLIAAKFARKDADIDHPYGHHRIETLATVGLGIFLIIVGLGIIYDAIIHVIDEAFVTPSYLTIVAAILSIIANEWLFRFTLKAGEKVNSDLLKANAWHSRSDSLSSVIVLIGIIASLLGLHFMDSLAAILVSLLIIKMGIKWSWQSLSELVDTAVGEETVEKIDQIIKATEGVKSHHQARTRLMAGRIFLDAHILIDSTLTASEGHHIAERVRARLAKNIDHIEDITIHIDVDEHPERFPKVSELAPSRSDVLKDLQGKFEGILPEKNILRIDLFYIKGKIRVQLILKRHTTSTQSSIDVLKAQLKKITREITYIQSIDLLYAV